MTAIVCFLLPAIFLMFMRYKILGDKVKCGFCGDVKSFLKEYLIVVLFLNVVVIAIAYVFFGHDGALDSDLIQNTKFTVRYIMLEIFISIIEPIAENVIRFHFTFKNERKAVKINKNIVLYLYAMVLFFMNFIRIFDNSFWEDEGFSIRLAKMSIPDMIVATGDDVHPPLYYLFTQLLYHILGNHGYTYHLSAIIPYALVIIIACTIVKKYFGMIPAVVLITMSSIMKNPVKYNVEARMYSLAALFVLMAFIEFYKIVEKNSKKNWILFCMMSLGAAYTHYYALISVAFLYLMLLFLVKKNKKTLKPLCLSYLVTILAYSPWLIILLKSFGRTADSWWLGDIPTIQDCWEFLFDYMWLSVIFAVCLIFFILYQLNIVKINSRRTAKFFDRTDLEVKIPKSINISNELFLIISGMASVCGTVAVGLVLSYTIRPFFILRYLFPVSAVIYLIFGICIRNLQWKRVWAIIIIFAILITNVPQYMARFNWERKTETETEAFLKEVSISSEAMIYTNSRPLDWTLLDYYYPESNHEYVGDWKEKIDSKYREIWVLWTDELDQTTLKSFAKQGYTTNEIYENAFANGIWLHVYKLQRK